MQKRALDEESPSAPVKRGKIAENSQSSEADGVGTKRIARPSKKDRFGKSAGRRRGTRPDVEDVDLAGADKDQKEKKERLPKRAVALMIGFSGTGYYGMQVQQNVKTIEGVLFDALVKAGAVSEDNADDPVKVALQRAARTDAGVHAAGNVVSMRLIISLPGVEDWVKHINSFLPDDIRVWGYVRTPNSFNARTNCSSRKYTYFLPTYTLLPPKPGSNLSVSLSTVNPPDFDVSSHPFWSASSSITITLPPHPNPSTSTAHPAAPDPDHETHKTYTEQHQADLLRKRAYRIHPSELTRFKETLKMYEGSHNFHNFTVGAEYGEKSNRRFMKSVEVEGPHVYGETEWIAIKIHGQSFMLHQRKMISAALLITRTQSPQTLITEMYSPNRLIVPRAPALGLLLEHPVYEAYNSKMEGVNKSVEKKFGSSGGNEGEGEDRLRPLIDFELFREKMEDFKRDFIYERMRSLEEKSGVFDGWIRSIDAYGGPDLRYYNHTGVIPDIAVMKRSSGAGADNEARRHQGFKEKRKFDSTSFGEDKGGTGGDGNVKKGEEEKVGVLADEYEEEVEVDKKLLAEMEG